MHDSQGAVTRLHTGSDNPQSRYIEDLMEGFLLALHLAPDAIEMLWSPTHFTSIKPRRGQSFG